MDRKNIISYIFNVEEKLKEEYKIYSKYISDGIIINMSSTDGIDTYNKYNTFYSSSKAAIINLSKSISLNTSNKVLCICHNWCD